MNKAEAASPDHWVLIRRVRQLITLRGPSGPRRGAAMNEIGVIPDGAILVHNGVIVEAGPSRRVENLQQARSAREVDAMCRLVMPAFVDPDAVLVSAPAAKCGDSDSSLSVISRRRLEEHASIAAASWARLGVLTVGAHSGDAVDLRETVKTLQVHHGLQNKPLRIRSILAPRKQPGIQEMTERWMPAGRKHKLASILELCGTCASDVRTVAVAGAAAGYSFRFRSDAALDNESQELAAEAGAIAILGPPPEGFAAGSVSSGLAQKLAAIGCVHVLPAGSALRPESDFASVRNLIDSGSAVALASGYGNAGYASFNPQFHLHLATSRFRMSHEEAICAATWNAACSLRMSHVTGSLEPGKSADLVIMDTSDYHELARRAGHNDVLAVVRSGQMIYKRAALTGDRLISD